MVRRDKSCDKYMVLKVTKKMCRKVTPVIQTGDIVLVSFFTRDIPQSGDFVLISKGTEQWLDEFSEGIKEKYTNIYKVLKFYY